MNALIHTRFNSLRALVHLARHPLPPSTSLLIQSVRITSAQSVALAHSSAPSCMDGCLLRHSPSPTTPHMGLLVQQLSTTIVTYHSAAHPLYSSSAAHPLYNNSGHTICNELSAQPTSYEQRRYLEHKWGHRFWHRRFPPAWSNKPRWWMVPVSAARGVDADLTPANRAFMQVDSDLADRKALMRGI